MSNGKPRAATLPRGADFGRLDPEGLGPTRAGDFETWEQDEENPIELIGGWVLPMPPGNFEAGESSLDLASVLRAIAKEKGWRISQDARHRLPVPRDTVVYPDIAIHRARVVKYIPGTETIGRVPDLVVEILGKKSYDRDIAPRGVKFLAYQSSGVQEYYYTWPDGREASGFALRRGMYVPLLRDREGFFASALLDHRVRLVEAAAKR
ncbi:MAG: Uma2 family endonuclease [Planctomycetes bacterium]|nr:Uma2 family endonuclease [Planctomycetota bacterium]